MSVSTGKSNGRHAIRSPAPPARAPRSWNGFGGRRREFDPNHPENIDRPDADPESVRTELELLESANRRFGMHRLVTGSFERLIKGRPSRRFSVLDLAAGAADVPRALVDWAERREIHLTITAVDANPAALEHARTACKGYSGISFEQLDIRTLACASRSFDVAICSSSLHHFSEPDAVAILKHMRDIARVGCLVVDLRRTRFSVMMTQLVARIAIRNRTFRSDAVKSCRAAFSTDEMERMTHEAGFEHCRVLTRHFGFHTVVEAAT